MKRKITFGKVISLSALRVNVTEWPLFVSDSAFGGFA
jgi:hypothetical protein